VSAAPDILFVTSTLEIGGSETKIVNVANALVKAGYRIAIAYLNPPDTLLERVDPAVPVTHLERRGKFSLESLRRLRRMTEAPNQVVISVNFYPLLYVVPAMRRSLGNKAACLINTTDFVCGQWIWGWVYAPFLRRCDQLVYGCRYQQTLWTEKYRLPARRSRYIYNGVDTAKYSPEENDGRAAGFRSRFGIPMGAVVIGGIGRFAPEKNFELLIRAVRELEATGRPAYLALVGEGAERRRLIAAAREAGLGERAVFPGVLNDVRDAIAAMDVFVLPSRAVETFSNAALEAMSMARPVVLSNIGGAAEMVVDGESGWLFDAGDVGWLMRILTDLYDSPPLRQRMGEAARQRVVDSFSFESMIEGYEELIRSLTDVE
jgi:glycosyltransferase involved in cell wall biosynthesis